MLRVSEPLAAPPGEEEEEVGGEQGEDEGVAGEGGWGVKILIKLTKWPLPSAGKFLIFIHFIPADLKNPSRPVKRLRQAKSIKIYHSS